MRASPRTIRTEARRGEWRRGRGSPRSRYFWFDSRSVSDGWAICKALASAGATIIVGTWPPVLGIFQKSLAAGKFDEDSTLEDGSKLKIEKIYPLDAVFDTRDDVPDDVMGNKRYAGLSGFTIQECADAVAKDYGKIDIFVHSLANGPEVAKPLLETSRTGYIAAMSASSYSLISCVQRFAPIMNEGGSFLSLGFIAANLVVPGYGGGMSSAKAQLESDTRVLAWEAGRNYGVRVNCISAGPLKSRAASAIQKGDKRTFIEVSAHPPRILPRFPSPLRPAAQLCRRPLEYRPSIGLCLALSPLSPASLEAPMSHCRSLARRSLAGGHRLLPGECSSAKEPLLGRHRLGGVLSLLARLRRGDGGDSVRGQRDARDGVGMRAGGGEAVGARGAARGVRVDGRQVHLAGQRVVSIRPRRPGR